MTARILVLGGAHIDRRGRISGATTPGASNPGSWMAEPGGGAFNAARALSRLGHSVRLITPRGGDAAGESVAQAAIDAGIDDRPFVFLDRATPSYTAILERDGNLVIALADMELYRLFTPRRLRVSSVRNALDETDLILTDANLPAETLAAICKAANDRNIPVAAIAISPAKVVRFSAILPQLDFLFMNTAEATALTGWRADTTAEWPALLRAKGLKAGIVTNGGDAVVAFNGDESAFLAPPPLDHVADVTGAGDAATAGFLDAVIAHQPLAEALRQAVACAAITLQATNATAANLSRAVLEQHMKLVPPAENLS